VKNAVETLNSAKSAERNWSSVYPAFRSRQKEQKKESVKALSTSIEIPYGRAPGNAE
jgi:hypothetical protein